MKRIFGLTAIMLIAFLIGTACGGGNHNGGKGGGGSDKTTLRVFLNGTPFLAATKKITTHVASISLLDFTASAQVATPLALSSNYSGFCQNIQPMTSSTLYGIGRWSDSNCAQNYSNFSNHGSPAIGAGNLTTLIAYGSGFQANSGKVEIMVNGIVISKSCTIGTQGSCQDVTTAPVADKDQIVVRVNSTDPADNPQDIRVLLVKE